MYIYIVCCAQFQELVSAELSQPETFDDGSSEASDRPIKENTGDHPKHSTL
jgi:hypothetical protein